MGQIEIEAGVRRGEADVRARARREPRPGQAAIAGAGVGRPEAGKAQRGRLGEPVGEPELEFLALLEPEERARRHSGVGKGRGRVRRRRSEREPRRRGLEHEEAVGRRNQRRGAGPAKAPGGRGKTAAEEGAPGQVHRSPHPQSGPLRAAALQCRAPFLAKLAGRATALLQAFPSASPFRGCRPDWRRNCCFFSGAGRSS